ncbi:hypothetical protein HanRHA438_Chr05g0208211 [Helianthus annuus]|nr:hypothetical protein HanIR_Chr05g0214311 [Helianthus annuus]KAJ0917635.1 hypothetical protein HanRHA438_Chr05g0208211 [Helianthus annuus]
MLSRSVFKPTTSTSLGVLSINIENILLSIGRVVHRTKTEKIRVQTRSTINHSGRIHTTNPATITPTD